MSPGISVRKMAPSMTTDRSGRVAGLLLAAGASTRMGQNKLFLELEGETLLRRVAKCAITADLDPVIVVLGYEAGKAQRELADLSVQTIVNEDYEKGVNSSVRLGIAAIPANVGAAVVMLADMPLVTTQMLAKLLTRYRETVAPLVISLYGEVNAPPMLYDRSLFMEIQTMEGEGCGRQVVKRHREEAEVVDCPAYALTDVDRPEDYKRMLAQLNPG